MVLLGFLLSYVAGAGTVAWFAKASLLQQFLPSSESMKETPAPAKEKPAPAVPAPPPVDEKTNEEK
jgi:hypothetical protein